MAGAGKNYWSLVIFHLSALKLFEDSGQPITTLAYEQMENEKWKMEMPNRLFLLLLLIASFATGFRRVSLSEVTGAIIELQVLLLKVRVDQLDLNAPV